MPLTIHDRLQFEDEHMAKSHAALFARLLIKDVVCGASWLKSQRKALPYYTNAVDGIHERLCFGLQNAA